MFLIEVIISQTWQHETLSMGTFFPFLTAFNKSGPSHISDIYKCCLNSKLADICLFHNVSYCMDYSTSIHIVASHLRGSSITWGIFTSRVSGRGHRIGAVFLCVCVCALSLLNCLTYSPWQISRVFGRFLEIQGLWQSQEHTQSRTYNCLHSICLTHASAQPIIKRHLQKVKVMTDQVVTLMNDLHIKNDLQNFIHAAAYPIACVFSASRPTF